MTQAKFIFLSVITFTLIGGALAYKANRISVRFYTRGTTATNTVFSVCNVPRNLLYTPDQNGATIIMASTTIDNVNDCMPMAVRENF